MNIHDWLAHLTDKAQLWPSYGGALSTNITKMLRYNDTQYQLWCQLVMDAPLSLNNLVYRHHLSARLIAQEIQLRQDLEALLLVMTVLLTHDCVFSPFATGDLWDGIDDDPHPIHSLRIKRPLVQDWICRLANRDDDTPHQLIHDHGLLSSVLLIYGLYLIHVILVYEMAIKPTKALSAILESSTDTLRTLKGVFNHVENQWFVPHVQ